MGQSGHWSDGCILPIKHPILWFFWQWGISCDFFNSVIYKWIQHTQDWGVFHMPLSSLALANLNADTLAHYIATDETIDAVVVRSVKRAFPTVTNWPNGRDWEFYHKIFTEYETPKEYNMIVIGSTVINQYMFLHWEDRYVLKEVVKQLNPIGVFKTRSGRALLVDLVRQYAIPVANAHEYHFVNRPLVSKGFRMLANLARTSFAYDPFTESITINKADIALVSDE